jgi:UDP-N-acetylglucosamine/UDP-N-acetylgalactosamine diphosphorylase
MERRGLSCVFYFQVDNPMVEICDPAFLGEHLRTGSEYSVKVCAKRDWNEGLGMVVERDGRTEIVEYSDPVLSDAAKQERGPDGRLRFLFGSVAIHVFSVPFLRREADAGLPLHIAHKKVPFCDASGATVKPDAPNAYKFEKFIFDALRDARKVVNVAFDRAEEFSPVKNKEGNDSPATCRRDLCDKWGRWLEAAGLSVPRDADGHVAIRLEIDPCYALDAAQFRARLAASGATPDTAQDLLFS